MYSSLQFIVEQLQRRGFGTPEILANTGIAAAELDDPWPYLLHEQYRGLVDNIYRLTDDAAIGLNLSDDFRARHMGIPGYAALTSKTFAEARKVLMAYRVLQDPYIYLAHQLSSTSWTIRLLCAFPAEDYVTRFAIEGHLVRTARFCADLTGHNRALTAIELSYPAPAYAERYRQLLPCPVVFDQPKNSITFDPEVLAQTLPADNAEMFSLCVQECDRRLSRLDELHVFRKKVYRELFRAHSLNSNGLLNLFEVASRLYISPRTLRRKLLAENTSFQHICNDTRRDLALHYLANNGLPIKQVAYALGYSSVNNFHRAFKQWTGKPVSEFSRSEV
jgi:AraC-like DNA-binding protein